MQKKKHSFTQHRFETRDMYPILRTRHSTYVGAYKCGRYPAVSFSCFLRLLRRVDDKTKETAARETNKLVRQALILPFSYVSVRLSVKRVRISKTATRPTS